MLKYFANIQNSVTALVLSIFGYVNFLIVSYWYLFVCDDLHSTQLRIQGPTISIILFYESYLFINFILFIVLYLNEYSKITVRKNNKIKVFLIYWGIFLYIAAMVWIGVCLAPHFYHLR